MFPSYKVEPDLTRYIIVIITYYHCYVPSGDGSMTENDKTGSSDADLDGIAKFMKNLLKDYDKIRGL